MDTSRKSAAYWASEFQKGSPAAFTHVFDLHYRSLCYFAGTILDDVGEVEDTVSEVFVKLWQKAADFNDLNSIKGFLYISTKNRCLDRLKQQKRQQASLSDYTYSLDETEDGLDYGVLEAEVLVLVYDEIERLPTKAQSIFKLIFFAGRGHGPYLQQHPVHGRGDGLLVQLRDHVRGGVHPHGHRCRHAGGSVLPAGDAGRGHTEVPRHKLGTRGYHCRPAVHLRLGLPGIRAT